MRILWRHTVRPRISQSGSNGSSIVSRPTRTTVSASARPKLSFNDAFTILLAPVLGTALIADTTWKDSKKEDWSKKIAQVEHEIAAIREREIILWNNLQARSVRHGAVQHRRTYSTAARACVDDAEFELEMPEDDTIQPDAPARQKPVRIPNISDAKLAEWKHYENLVASKLAIEMILHIRSGKSVLNRLPADIVLDQKIYPESLDDLVRQLIRINANLEVFATARTSEAVPQPLLDTEERYELHERISALSQSCRRGQIPVRDLVNGYAQAVAESQTAPSIATYNVMLEALSVQDSNSLAYSVMAAMKNSKQHLSNRAIWSMLWQYGKYKDSGRLDEFLWLLTKEKSVLRLRGKWQMVYVNGVRIPIPVDRDPHLISILVRAALQCGMLHKAEAWATVVFQQGQKCRKFASIFGSMIQYCAEHGDWKSGRQWIDKTIKWASLLSREAPDAFNRIIFRMLDLCVVCDQPAEYDRIIRATAESGIEINVVDKERPAHFSDRALSIRDDWEGQMKHELKFDNASDQSMDGKVFRFQELLARADSTIKPFIGIVDIADLTASSTSQTKGDLGRDQEQEHLSPEEIIGNIQSLDTSSTNKNIRQLRRSLKELLKQSEKQKSQIQGLIAELTANRTELAQMKTGVNAQLSGNKDQTLDAQQEPRRSQSSKQSTHLTHLHLITDYQKMSKDFGQAQHDIKCMREENEQLRRQLEQSSDDQIPRLEMTHGRSAQSLQMSTETNVGLLRSDQIDPRRAGVQPIKKVDGKEVNTKGRPKLSNGTMTTSQTRSTERYFLPPASITYTTSGINMTTNTDARNNEARRSTPSMSL